MPSCSLMHSDRQCDEYQLGSELRHQQPSQGLLVVQKPPAMAVFSWTCLLGLATRVSAALPEDFQTFNVRVAAVASTSLLIRPIRVFYFRRRKVYPTLTSWSFNTLCCTSYFLNNVCVVRYDIPRSFINLYGSKSFAALTLQIRRAAWKPMAITGTPSVL